MGIAEPQPVPLTAEAARAAVRAELDAVEAAYGRLRATASKSATCWPRGCG